MMKQKIQITKVTTRELIKEDRREIETERTICNKNDLIEEMKKRIPKNYDKAAIQFLYSRKRPIFLERKNEKYVDNKGKDLCQYLDEIGNAEILLKRVFFFIENETENTRTSFCFEPIDLCFLKEKQEEPFKLEVYSRENDDLHQEYTCSALQELEEELDEIDNDLNYTLLNGYFLNTHTANYKRQFTKKEDDERICYCLIEEVNKGKNRYVINLGEYDIKHNETYFYQSYYVEKSKIL